VKSSKNSARLLVLVSSITFSFCADADRIASGAAHNVVFSGSGYVSSWGANDSGQLGDGSTLDAFNPVNVVESNYSALSGAIAAVSYNNNNILIMDDNTLLGWGENENGQLGSGFLYSGKFLKAPGDEDDDDEDNGTPDPDEPDGTESGTTIDASPIQFPTPIVDTGGVPISNVVQVDTGSNFSAAVTQAGTVLIWGDLSAFEDLEKQREPVNPYWEMYFDPDGEFVEGPYLEGDPDTGIEMMEMRDANGNLINGIVSVAVGDNHLIALTNTGFVLAWGANDAGQLADGTLRQRAFPVYVLESADRRLSGISSISAYGNGNAAVKRNGHLVGWGSSLLAVPLADEVIDPSRPDQSFAAAVLDDEGNPIVGTRRVVLGASHVLAITFHNTVIAWGDNSSGQLGNGTNSSVEGTSTVVTSSGSPLRNVFEIAVGESHSIALRSDGQVFAWGNSENGRLGDGTNIDSYYAVQVRRRDNFPFSLY
jgi:alpha-tubulin suppressor-like RCC1 family protein